ncbi:MULTISPECIES: hypothetical protein [Cyanophyceae]|uniref:hypothetical protein n=1 Tax=Cyanophyceae TaxID=3028117 RepID=UPI001689E705|nr:MULTISPECIES: hypothetical protein [Cyanophyceae]MBD1917649.1 hypothetical protein [Phormidium sp. FACHB-77]MBD2031195.1 hypothetical protein [Phormidium sp. FACHB-322]MBD2050737.1 hypothetical protein [Leptolyngbya sp. FACHB-60]
MAAESPTVAAITTVAQRTGGRDLALGVGLETDLDRDGMAVDGKGQKRRAQPQAKLTGLRRPGNFG